jgi:hypothetical protein
MKKKKSTHFFFFFFLYFFVFFCLFVALCCVFFCLFVVPPPPCAPPVPSTFPPLTFTHAIIFLSFFSSSSFCPFQKSEYEYESSARRLLSGDAAGELAAPDAGDRLAELPRVSPAVSPISIATSSLDAHE